MPSDAAAQAAISKSQVLRNPCLITAVICTFKRYDLLEKSIQSLEAQSLPKEQYEIVVVDNSGDYDRSMEFSARYYDTSLRWIYEARAGLSNARNIGIAAAASPFIAFLDDDAEAEPQWLSSFLAAFERLGESAAVIGGPVRPAWGAARPEWLDDRLLSCLSVLDLGPYVRFIEDHEWLVGANVCYRADRLRDAGGFDVALGRSGSGASLMSNDETELGRRLLRAGGRSGYAPGAAVDHFIDPSRLNQQWFRRRMAWQAVSEYVENPSRMQASARDAWDALKLYMAHCPPVDRTVRALALPRETPSEFYWQTTAVFNAVAALLSGVADPNET